MSGFGCQGTDVLCSLMKLHFKVRVGSVMGYFAFCRLG
ncbi:hypothetical protein D1AOALGA4SA_3440 [Olavius algarvensis Delta 1 endosymbiont]|nr:hypothetical protein D1AOALGA4SA_3440 [Olavius algarvensis Delta 1 endosymbiont]